VSYYDRRPAGTGRSPLLAPVRWLQRMHPLQSWLVVMAVIVGLSMLGLRLLALLIAVGWTGYAIFTWLSPRVRAQLRSWFYGR
jgi:hypothetical protein